MNSELLKRIAKFLRRHRFNSACVIVMLSAVGVSAIVLKDSAAIETEYDALSLEGGSMLDARLAGPTLREELAFVRQAIQRVDESLFDENDRPENYEYFRTIATKSQAALADLQQLSSEPAAPDDYKLVPFSLRITGTYEQVHAFINTLETGPRFAKIVSFSLGRIPASEMELSLEMKVQLLARS